MARVCVFIASSLDGFIAGPNDELDWLPGGDEIEDTFTPFFAQVGALLMGRRTFDVVNSFDGPWPYGDTPVLVPTSRSLDTKRASVRALSGELPELVDEAKRVAADRHVYLDGGSLVRAALDARLVDEITVTMVPTVLGAGKPLFAGTAQRHALELLGSRTLGGGLVELRYRPADAPTTLD